MANILPNRKLFYRDLHSMIRFSTLVMTLVPVFYIIINDTVQSEDTFGTEKAYNIRYNTIIIIWPIREFPFTYEILSDV